MKNKIYEIAASALEGESSALEIYSYLRDLKDAIEESLEQINSIALSELEKYKEKQINGFNYKTKNAPGKWDYSNVMQIQELNTKRKQYEELAKQAQKSNCNIADENGEVINAASYKQGATIIYREKSKIEKLNDVF